MIVVTAVEGKTEDLTGMDWVRLQGRICEINAARKPVLIGFGQEPVFFARRGEFFRLVKVTPGEFRKALPTNEDRAFLGAMDAEGE